jgi:hypothetical protein
LGSFFQKDHGFDKASGKEQAEKKLGTITVIEKGTLGVRWEKTRINQSKYFLQRKWDWTFNNAAI